MVIFLKAPGIFFTLVLNVYFSCCATTYSDEMLNYCFLDEKAAEKRTTSNILYEIFQEQLLCSVCSFPCEGQTLLPR